MNTKMRSSSIPDFALAMAKLLKGVDDRGLTKSCLNCTYFQESSETCQKYNARPPARVIVNACEGYSDVDDVPF